MDTLTHAAFGLVVGALRRPDGAVAPRVLSPTDRAVLLGCALAAELPDLDYLWPAGDAVLRTLQAHRGPSHALVAVPLVALVAAGLAKLLFRDARILPVYLMSIVAVVLGHLLPDLWTGWGTRLFWPWSTTRHALDWTMVIDPLVTLPMLAGAVWGWRRRARWRRAVLIGAAVTTAYIGGRVLMREVLTARVAAAHPRAEHVAVFPSLLRVLSWRFVVVEEGGYVAGMVTAGGGLREEARMAPFPDGLLTAGERQIPTVREALAWARFPRVVIHRAEGSVTLHIADLRYHLGGAPTLEFVLELAGGQLRRVTLLRGGGVRELLDRWRRAD